MISRYYWKKISKKMLTEVIDFYIVMSFITPI